MAKVTPWDNKAHFLWCAKLSMRFPTMDYARIAAKRSMQIGLKTKLGSCKLDISAQLRKLSEADLKKLVLRAMQYIIWHEVPAKAFAKEESFKRDAVFSPEFADHVSRFIELMLSDYFDGIKIGTEQYVKPIKVVDYAKLSEEEKAKIRAAVLAELEAENSTTEAEAEV